MTAKRKRKAWAQSFGPYGHRIRIFEDTNSGILYAEVRDPSVKCGYRCLSLRHRDRERAKAWATRQVAQLMAGDSLLRDPKPTLARVLSLYLQHRTPAKCPPEQNADRRRAKLWTRVLGPQKDLSKLTMHEWQQFTRDRQSGVIDATGNAVPQEKRKPVRAGTVAADLTFLKSVLSWATRWQDSEARYVMRENPARGYPIPSDRNPRRPVATQDRYERVRAVAEQVTMQVGRARTRREVQNYLSTILDIVNGTGRRISAVLALRYADLRLDQGPQGSIKWPADTDKNGKEWLVPMSREVRAAIDRILEERPGIGAAYLFPAPRDPSQPVNKDVAAMWLIEAEKLAGLQKQDGSLWHAYRRGWATARKHLPDVDVAAAGGWSDTTTLKQVYQQADQETMYKVVSEPAVIREARS